MKIITLLVVEFAFLAVECRAQDVDKLNDTIDLRPSWYTELFKGEICIRIYCGPLHGDNDMLDNDVNGSLLWHRQPKVGGSLRDSCDMSGCTDIYLLAWLQRESVSSRVYAGEEPYNERVALALARKQDNEGAEKWILLTLTSDYHKGDTSLRDLYWHLSRGYDYNIGNAFLTMKAFDSLPTNAEIYQTLEEWTSANGGFFNYDAITKKNVWKGFEFFFADGDVREKTWEAVIGEKPTKFFPNGK